MKFKRKMIHIDEELCNGCGQCVPGCEEGALQVINGKARLVAEKYCDGLGACLGECPTGALTIREVQAEDFDPQAVANRLKEQGRAVPDHMPDPESLRLSKQPTLGCGCPSSALTTLTPCGQANIPQAQHSPGSQLSHWPIQLRLVPPDAPFLRNANLLITADCTAAALPNYHQEYVPDRVVLMACPKFDEPGPHLERLAAIFAAAKIESVLVLEMEVPCCRGLGRMVSQAMTRAATSPKAEKITVARDGRVLGREPLGR